ncbi:hypothetical protein V6N13_129621 [Hibiscus sabdariffa]|uniref:Uncharacterized protein n=1 Tax=Hibiscus sabdariffa TaxID=183260 RepID=A0ABR2SLP8_9ROSI
MGSELVLFALKKIEKPFVELQKLKLFSKTYGWRLEPTNKWGEGVTLNLNLIATSQSVDLLVYLLESCLFLLLISYTPTLQLMILIIFSTAYEIGMKFFHHLSA